MTAKLKSRALSELVGLMERFQFDMAYTLTRESYVPSEWEDVWKGRTGKRRKVSLYVDEDVYRLFKSMGPGMGPRMNIVLGAFVRARVAGLLAGEDLVEESRRKFNGRAKPEVREVVERLWDPGE